MCEERGQILVVEGEAEILHSRRTGGGLNDGHDRFLTVQFEILFFLHPRFDVRDGECGIGGGGGWWLLRKCTVRWIIFPSESI